VEDLKATAPRKMFIERYGLEAVPSTKQNTSWYQFSFIQIAIAANSGNFLIPALAVIEGGLSFWTGVLSTSLGAFLGFLLVSCLSLPGARLGIPAQYALRTILGVHGTRFMSAPIRTLTSLYWFSVQTIGGTFVIQELVVRITGVSLPFWIYSLPLSILMVVLAIIGFDAVKKATSYFLPLLLFGEATILYIYFTKNNQGVSVMMLQEGGFGGSLPMMFFFASLAFVQYVSGVSASADMTRYAKSPSHGFWGLLIGNSIGFFITAIIGCASAYLYDNVNPYVSSSNETSSPLLIAIITLTAIVSMISINVSNAYTGGFSLLNTLTKISRIQAAVLFGTIGVFLSGFPSLVNEAESFISFLGGLIIPISAVICSDYLMIKHGHLNEDDLSLLSKPSSLNIHAILAVLIGGILYFLLPSEWSPGFITFIFVFCIYPLLLKNRPPWHI
jgi:purine-cytosine permease-like protein